MHMLPIMKVQEKSWHALKLNESLIVLKNAVKYKAGA